MTRARSHPARSDQPGNGNGTDPPPGPRIVVALDYADPRAALDFAARVTPAECRLKVGKELFTRGGPAVVEALCARGFEVFLDLKFHDIPNTVAGAVRAAADLGVWMLNVHAAGGPAMLEAAAQALPRGKRPLLIAVTVLTSMDDTQLDAVGWPGPAPVLVRRLALLAAHSGLDGVVCSAQEVAGLRAALPAGFRFVTPGIRPPGGARDDQRRVTTPGEAIRAGASYLVIGRPVTAADEPAGVLLTLNEEIAATGRT